MGLWVLCCKDFGFICEVFDFDWVFGWVMKEYGVLFFWFIGKVDCWF